MTSSRPAALIVEDQPFVGMVASDILKEWGFETFHAFDADAAARLLDEHPEIEVVVTEALLPGTVNGLELAKRVSTERPEVQLIVTASGPELHREQVPGGARLLRKPYATHELQMLIEPRRALADA